ncbi:MAG TPA: phosphomethylpyrimidine synthase ThiC [Rhizomicrobium sp.]|nr:phosphomethylpyrimidine synthase ThiC [Rhizomicrobium sp.]
MPPKQPRHGKAPNRIAQKQDVQVMIEGFDHVPMHKIRENMDRPLKEHDERLRF